MKTCAVILLLLCTAATSAEAAGCALNDASAPRTSVFLKGVVRGPATSEEVHRQTAIAVIRSQAPESPAYVNLPRVFVIYEVAGVRHGTIAAVVSGAPPQPGAVVKLASRRRDPDRPCAFIPWTVVPEGTNA